MHLPPPWNPDCVICAQGTHWRLVDPGPSARGKVCYIFLKIQIYSPRDLSRIQVLIKMFLKSPNDLLVTRQFPLQPGLNDHTCLPRLGSSLLLFDSRQNCKDGLCDAPHPQLNLLYLLLTPLCRLPLPSLPWDTHALRHKFSGKAWHINLNDWVSYSEKCPL